ncbi:hypothetical protein [Candidatus Palauibacter sp.]|uniref:hypothetical protein n=1 Tax=Candidatus Palauibacter sp. TaxID=3101350 RepID=UPI003B0229DB
MLKPVSLREAWPNEARDFTPWLAQHIDQLGAKLDLRLERVRVEVTLPGAGRVDICAQQAETGAQVVIENQLGESDDSHCLRLLGYAANAEASILVWVARNFTPYHQNILEWLNEADTIHVYAVTVRAYRVGDALAANFRTVVEPPEAQQGPPSSAGKNANTLYAEFYRPLVARLRQRGVRPVGKGGWRGRWRSFETGHRGAVYGAVLHEGKARVFLSLNGSGHQQRYRTLLRHRGEIDGSVEGTVLWREGSEGAWDSRVMLGSDEAVSLTGPVEDLETARQWMADNLLSLRDAVQAHLDQVMGAEDADPDEV